jgi:predicted RNA-binding Zn ribbon-like protein
MVFAHDTEMSLLGTAALVNTAQENDELATVAALDEFVARWKWTGSRRRTAAELREVQALRPRLRALWHADREQATAIVNGLLREFDALPQLVRHDEFDYHIHATGPEAPLAARMAVEAAMAMVDVIRMDELHRLRVCGADDCEDVLVDLSKNRSRQYCTTRCSNRVNVAAFRARRGS